MGERIMLTPLTPEEQQYAEDNYKVLTWCMKSLRLTNEQYGTAALGYIHAVKKWYASPELQQWSFQTIVRNTVRSHISNERKKDEKRVSALSLDDVIPGTEGLTYGCNVTYNNINYIERTSTGMKPSYDVPIPSAAKLGRQPNVDMELLVNFLDGKHSTMCLEYDTAKEATKKAGNFRSYRKNHKLTNFEIYKLDCKIYVEKVKTTKKSSENTCRVSR